MQKIINAFKQIEALNEQESNIMSAWTYAYCMENGIAHASTIEEAYQELNSGENKMLNIGIVGRVKAGKSSLLNAIFFKGEDILPKAATPMTASLTLLGYGNNEASVELFSKSDIADIKKEHDAYLAIKEQKFQDTLAQAKSKLLKLRKTLTPQLETQLRQQVEKAMLSQPARPYYELYEGIASSPLLARIEQSDQSITQTINAATPQAIAAELNNYVGSAGANSTITKSAQLLLDIPELKELRIIDTPGLNDPVASRSQRTVDFMKQCDVIFVVSPSSQFMSEADVNLMINAIQEQSINQIYVIASQADMTMISDVADKNGHVFAPSFDNLRRDLQLSLSDCLRGSQRQVLQQALSGAQVLLTSSICFSLERKLAAGTALSENEQLVLSNLTSTYPDAFSTPEQTQAALQQLAGVSAVQAAVAEVRARKDAIIKERQASFEHDQRASVERYLEYLNQKLQEGRRELEDTELSTLQQSQEEIAQIRQATGLEINLAFTRSFTQLKSDLRSYLSSLSQRFVNRAGTNASQSLSVSTSVTHHESGILFWKEHWTTQFTTKSLDASQVRLEVQAAFSQMVTSVRAALDKVLEDWIDKAVREEIAVTNQLDMGWCIKYGLRVRDIEQAVKLSIFELKENLPQLNLDEFNFTTSFNDSKHEQAERGRFAFLFSRSVSSANGSLHDEEAEEFLTKLHELLAWFSQTFDQKCERYLSELEQLSHRVDLSGSIFGKLDQQLALLQQQLAAKEETLKHYQICQDRLAQIAAELKA